MTLKKINESANLWEKTKNPKYKDLWYKLVKEFANGPHNIKRWSIPSSRGNEGNDKRNTIIE